MPDESQGVPVTWRELLASDIGEQLLGRFALVPDLLAGQMANPVEVFSVACISSAGVSILHGGKALEPVLNAARAKLEFAVRLLELRPTSNSALVLQGFLSTLNALACAGLVDAPFGGADATSTIDKIAQGLAGLDEKEAHRVGLAAVAAGRTELVPKFVGGGKLPARFKPGETFRFNVPAFARYLAVAVHKAAVAADVSPAWLDFVSAFPHKLAAGTLDWPDLLWAGRIYYHGFEKRPVGQVADTIRELVSAS